MSEVKEYHGKIVTIGSLPLGKQEIPCQAIERKVPGDGSRWNTGFELPNLFIITNNEEIGIKNGHNISYTRYQQDVNLRDQNPGVIPSGFEIRILTGEQGQKMLQAYLKHKYNNMTSHLNYYKYLGSDPEIFVEDGAGKIIPAFEFLGSKDKPKHTHRLYAEKRCGVYWDGFQAEFEVEPGSCMAYHMDSVHLGLKEVFKAARAYNSSAKLSNKNVVQIPLETLRELPEEYVSLGCMPSFNAYGLQGKLSSPRELTYRPAGGHIHFGVGTKTKEENLAMVKALDAITGVACVSLFAEFDNPVRRQYYGLAGEYRTPEHGIEYRTLSNAWLMHPTLAHMVFEIGRSSLMFGLNGFMPYWEGSEQETVEIINNCDVAGARKVLERNIDLFKKIIAKSHLDSYTELGTRTLDLAYNIFTRGAETVIANPEDIVGNWDLEGNWRGHSNGVNRCWATSIGNLEKGKLI